MAKLQYNSNWKKVIDAINHNMFGAFTNAHKVTQIDDDRFEIEYNDGSIFELPIRASGQVNIDATEDNTAIEIGVKEIIPCVMAFFDRNVKIGEIVCDFNVIEGSPFDFELLEINKLYSVHGLFDNKECVAVRYVDNDVFYLYFIDENSHIDTLNLMEYFSNPNISYYAESVI